MEKSALELALKVGLFGKHPAGITAWSCYSSTRIKTRVMPWFQERHLHTSMCFCVHLRLQCLAECMYSHALFVEGRKLPFLSCGLPRAFRARTGTCLPFSIHSGFISASTREDKHFLILIIRRLLAILYFKNILSQYPTQAN